MAEQVWKYEWPQINGAPYERTSFSLPVGARVVHVSLQNGNICLWAIVNPAKAVNAQREFILVGTGFQIEEGASYLGTVLLLDGRLVLHVFEKQP